MMDDEEFDFLDEGDEEIEEVVDTPPPGVSPLTLEIEKVSATCQKDFAKYVKKMSWR